MRLVHLATQVNPAVVFYTTYQERTLARTLTPYLDLFSLTAKNIPLSSFIHPAHAEGVSEFVRERREMNSPRGGVKRRLRARVAEVMSFENIYLIKITKTES